MFALEISWPNSFSNIFPRQLSGGHTHLYTKESLYYLAKKNNYSTIISHRSGETEDNFIAHTEKDRENYIKKLIVYFVTPYII